MLYPPPELTPVQREMIHASQLGYVDHKYEEFPSETDRKMFSDLPPEILEVLVLLPHDQEWIFFLQKFANSISSNIIESRYPIALKIPPSGN